MFFYFQLHQNILLTVSGLNKIDHCSSHSYAFKHEQLSVILLIEIITFSTKNKN